MALIGIIIPTFLEAQMVIKETQVKEPTIIQGKPFYSSLFLNNELVISICGIGKANAAHCAGLMIERYCPSLIINIGVAGAYQGSGLKIGDLAIAEKEVYADEGLRTNKGEFVSMHSLDLPILKKETRSFFNEFDTVVPELIRDELPKGVFLTVSTCTGSSSRAKELIALYNPICENMEGCAISHISACSNIPFVEIRAISNIITERDKGGIDRLDLLNASTKVQGYLLANIHKIIPKSSLDDG